MEVLILTAYGIRILGIRLEGAVWQRNQRYRLRILRCFFKEQVTSFTEDNKFNGNLKITIGENKFDLKVPFQTLRTGSEGEICNVWDLMEDYYSESGDNSNIKNFLGNMSVFTRWYAYETRINDIFGDYEVSHN